jgi:hypothetical protein
MRPVLHGDVAVAGRVLLAAPPPARAALLARMLREADLADAWRQTTGRAHPVWGGGSLMAAAMARPRAPEPFLDDPDYAACLALVFEALVARAAG